MYAQNIEAIELLQHKVLILASTISALYTTARPMHHLLSRAMTEDSPNDYPQQDLGYTSLERSEKISNDHSGLV